jgi:hypothetical protein
LCRIMPKFKGNAVSQSKLKLLSKSKQDALEKKKRKKQLKKIKNLKRKAKSDR